MDFAALNEALCWEGMIGVGAFAPSEHGTSSRLPVGSEDRKWEIETRVEEDGLRIVAPKRDTVEPDYRCLSWRLSCAVSEVVRFIRSKK